MKHFFITVILIASFISCGNAQPLKVVSSLSAKTTEIIIEGFTQETKIPAEVSYLPSGTFDERLNYIYKENIDCIIGATAEEFYLANRLKMLIPYLAAESYKIPPKFRTPHGAWTNLWLQQIAILSNADSLRDLGLYAPDTLTELLNPKLYNEITLPDYQTGGASYAFITSIWQLKGEDTALHFAHEFNKQKIFLTESVNDAITDVLNGQRTIAIVPLRAALNAENQYPNLYATILQDANRNLLSGVGILRGTKNLDYAKKFIDYLISDKCIEFCNNNGLPYLWHVKQFSAEQKIKTAIDDLHWSTLNKNEIIRQWKQA